MADSMRNAICARTQTSKVQTRVALRYISLSELRGQVGRGRKKMVLYCDVSKTHSSFFDIEASTVHPHLASARIWKTI